MCSGMPSIWLKAQARIVSIGPTHGMSAWDLHECMRGEHACQILVYALQR